MTQVKQRPAIWDQAESWSNISTQESQLPVPSQKLSEILEFIREWLEHGDVKKACDKFKVDKSLASKILRGKAKPKVDFLKELKDKAEKNYQKLRLQHK